VDVSVTLVVTGQKDRVRAQLVDLSEGGCFFATSLSLKPGWQISLFFARPGQRLCIAMGTIVRGAEGAGFGVEFNTVNDALRTFVEALVRSSEEDRKELVAGVAQGEIHIS
jgi:hypothetical protein